MARPKHSEAGHYAVVSAWAIGVTSSIARVIRMDGPPQDDLVAEAHAYRHCVVLSQKTAATPIAGVQLQPLRASSDMVNIFDLCFAISSPLRQLLAAEDGGLAGHFDRLIRGSYGEIDEVFSGVVLGGSGSPVAMAIITRREDHLWYAWLMVKPHYRNNGLGSRLLLNPLSSGDELRLCVDANSHQHQHYERLGFSPIGVEYTKYLV